MLPGASWRRGCLNSLERYGNPVMPHRGLQSWEPQEKLVVEDTPWLCAQIPESGC